MKRQTAMYSAHSKREIRTWDAPEASSGEDVHSKQFFIAWDEGCLMGTYDSLEEASEPGLGSTWNNQTER
jgi:hypothetical protein